MTKDLGYLCFIVELLKWRWLYISIKIYKKNNQLGTLYIQYSIKLKTFSFDKFFLLFSTARARIFHKHLSRALSTRPSISSSLSLGYRYILGKC